MNILKNRFYTTVSALKSDLKFNKSLPEILAMNKKPGEIQEISEGLAKIQTTGNVFYNPVQEFNRDLSIAVITNYVQNLNSEATNNKDTPQSESINNSEGISILEALSATGLRSIRYAKEIPGIKTIIANDVSLDAVNDINRNIILNDVGNLISSNHDDATMLMYQHRKDQFDIIDLDPYGCPSIFLDSAVQSVKSGGLLLITATDMAVLAGNTPETCYVKYGAISLRMKCCHEMAIRILLQCIETHANRYSRSIEPILSISADFYVRVFVKVFSGAQKCKSTTSKLSHVFHCTGCDSFVLHPLGIKKNHEKNQKLVKFSLPCGPPVSKICEHCGGSHHMGGPIWSAPIHSQKFVEEVLASASPTLGTFKRIQGVLSMISEELHDVPLYYTLERLAGTLKVETPSMLIIRSAILNAGYRVSYTHANKTSIKTDASARVIWDIMRCWEQKHPASKKRIAENKIACTILAQKPLKEYSFDLNANAKPQSKQLGLVRFQLNPLPNWGPGSRATAMVGENKKEKRQRNQGKRKRAVLENDDGTDRLD